MVEILFWLFAGIFWWLECSPGMVEWWRKRRPNRADLAELHKVQYVEDMFKEKK